MKHYQAHIQWEGPWMIKFVRVLDPVNIVFRFEKEPPKHCICDCSNEDMWIYVIKNAITIHEKNLHFPHELNWWES